MRRPRTDYRAKHQGSIALEVLLALPLIVLVTLATIQFSLMLLADQKLLLAAYNGATAARHGGTEADIQVAVDKALQTTVYRNNRTIRIFRVDPPATDVPIATIGPAPTNTITYADVVPPIDTTASQPSLAAIRVVVEIRADKVVPNLLTLLQYDLANYFLDGSVVLPKE